MRDGAAENHRMKQPIGMEVINELAAAADEPKILAALDGAADERIPHCALAAAPP
jgi:hypothetical protein